jgi:hypothetical protein
MKTHTTMKHVETHFLQVTFVMIETVEVMLE